MLGLLWLVALAVPAFSAEYQAGTAKIDITPPLGGHMYGYGARGDNVSTGVHDPLYAKVLVVSDGSETFALVTADLGSFGKPYIRAVRAQVNAAIGLENVFVIASHSHSTPVFESDFPNPREPWLRELERKIAGVVVEAHRNLEPARFAVGQGPFEACHNRRKVLADGTVQMMWENREGLPTDPVDPTFGVVAVDTADGEPLATLVSYACHPVILGPDNLELSADYPGAMMALVEKEIGGQAMFAQGAPGDINPFWDKTPLGDGAYEAVQRVGEGLGRQVASVRRQLKPTPASNAIAIETLAIELEPRWDLDDRKVQQAFESNEFGWIFERYRQRFAVESEAEVNVVLVGDVFAFATFPGEFFVEHQLRLRHGSAVPNTLFFGYTNGELGYFPTIRAAAEGGYGGKEATIVEVGAGEKLVSRALISLHYLAGKLHRIPKF